MKGNDSTSSFFFTFLLPFPAKIAQEREAKHVLVTMPPATKAAKKASSKAPKAKQKSTKATPKKKVAVAKVNRPTKPKAFDAVPKKPSQPPAKMAGGKPKTPKMFG